MLVINTLSRPFVQVPISVEVAGSPYNPSNDPVALAFTSDPSVKPQPSDWHTGQWEPLGGNVYAAQCLVGPGGAVQLAAGTYAMWVQITDSPELVVLPGGGLEVQ